ncbi:hypothetical protein CEXT_237661 [Caerostris extrusa]|uniref:Uncharacterized protein n=1 Tax=Caerostris extrusa TaxID=172846 RepID=A0AAV4RQ60_CAEEX|nr:hypothetical protein CEXT_237661 [Caerostris extrusa]
MMFYTSISSPSGAYFLQFYLQSKRKTRKKQSPRRIAVSEKWEYLCIFFPSQSSRVKYSDFEQCISSPFDPEVLSEWVSEKMFFC